MATTMQHPTFSDVTREVPDGDVKAWQEQGWTTQTGKGNGKAKSSSKASSKDE